uniref:Uncharacterized protein n=1 Tax=Anopheles farauti TaxID=69004 RepID=A0A182QVD0_9DIPT
MVAYSVGAIRFEILLALLLLPLECFCQTGQGSSGFGYELLRTQLDEVQDSISQLQRGAERNNNCNTLDTVMATILSRLEAIETKLDTQSRMQAAERRQATLREIIGIKYTTHAMKFLILAPGRSEVD